MVEGVILLIIELAPAMEDEVSLVQFWVATTDRELYIPYILFKN